MKNIGDSLIDKLNYLGKGVHSCGDNEGCIIVKIGYGIGERYEVDWQSCEVGHSLGFYFNHEHDGSLQYHRYDINGLPSIWLFGSARDKAASFLKHKIQLSINHK